MRGFFSFLEYTRKNLPKPTGYLKKKESKGKEITLLNNEALQLKFIRLRKTIFLPKI